MKIGELAKKADTSAETIRYYEQAGLLPKTMRSEGNYRIYSSPHLEQLIVGPAKFKFQAVLPDFPDR